jgi:hypothetical protein
MTEEQLKNPEQLTTSIGRASNAGSHRTTGIADVMGSTWSDKIIFDAQPDRVLSKHFLEFTDLMSNNDVTIIIPRIGDVNLMGGRGTSTATINQEGIGRVLTDFSTAGNLTVSLTSDDVKLGGCAVSFETASATRVSIVEMAHKQLVRQYLNTLETDANALLEGATIHATTGAGTVSGGTVADNLAIAAAQDAIAAGDVITVDKIVDMKIRLQSLDFAKKPGEAVLFVHPHQFKQLLKSSQFTNSAEFGSPTVVRKGIVEEYIGVIIEVSTLITAFKAADRTAISVDGHLCYMIDPTAAGAIVWKEKAVVKVVTEADERRHKILLDAWYRMARINNKAIVVGVFADN